ncbi:MAG TPA: cation:proton antiporter, partial [Chthoniobacteraceae bacterium]|nr:cation:proton antiporter [Chthoniobacteraceae bacterium]
LLSRMEKICHDEISLLFALTVCLVTAAITEAIGLSLALGAFLGGMMLGDSHYAHTLAEKTLPIRDAFVALFFVSIGMLIDPHDVLSHLPLLLVIAGLVLVGKFLVWSTVVRIFGYPFRTALRVGAGLTQIGEFSFVLAQLALESKLISHDVYNAALAASLVTILVNASVVKALPRPAASQQNGAAVLDL